MPNIFYTKIKRIGSKGELDIEPTSTLQHFLNKLTQGETVRISIQVKKPTRSDQQNRALHLWYGMVADELNDAGYTVQKVLKHKLELSWTPELVKEILWRSAQKRLLNVQSTTELKKVGDIDSIYDHLNRHLSEKFFISVPFPFDEDKAYTNLMSMQGIRDKFIKK